MGLLGESESLIIVTVFLLCLSFIIVSLRCWVRISIKGFGLDDWLMALGLIFYIGTCIPIIIGSNYGIGTRDIYLTPEQKAIGHKSYFIFQIFYCLDAICTKSGISVALIRLSSNKRTVYYPAMFIMIMSIIAGGVTLIIVLSVCTPIETQWNPTAGKCLSPSVIINISYFISAACILTDFSCAILPIVLLWNVQLNWKIKCTIACILGFGFLASTATIVRLKYFGHYRWKTDYLYGLADIAVWSIVELGVGLSAGSAAALRPLLRLISSGSLQSSDQTKYARNRFGTAEDTATTTGKDVSLHVMVKGGKAPSAGDTDSQREITDEEAIFIRSEINVVEDFVRRDAI